MTLNDSLDKSSSFNREEYATWKVKMRIFINGMYFDIWKIVKTNPFVPTRQVMVMW